MLRLAARLLLPLAVAVPCAGGQQPLAQSAAHGVVVLDPAHGGPDAGAHLADQALEKDVTLAMATRIRATLAAAGFAVSTTRDGDLTAMLPPDQRAEAANRQHAFACLVLHATATGSGAHLYISQLAPSAPSAMQGFAPVRWESAQAGFVPQSEALRTEIAAALKGRGVPVVTGTAPVRPLDNLLCPAVVLELAPLSAGDSERTPVSDSGYQQRVADALAAALKVWRDRLQSSGSTSPQPRGGSQ